MKDEKIAQILGSLLSSERLQNEPSTMAAISFLEEIRVLAQQGAEGDIESMRKVHNLIKEIASIYEDLTDRTASEVLEGAEIKQHPKLTGFIYYLAYMKYRELPLDES